MLENLGTVSVSSGATLRTTGLISPVVDSLAVDGVSGSGTITGFTFADNVTVNVTGRPRNSPSGVIAIDFSGCKGFDKARWTFLEDGKPPVRRSFRMTENGIVVTNHGFRLILR